MVEWSQKMELRLWSGAEFFGVQLSQIAPKTRLNMDPPELAETNPAR